MGPQLREVLPVTALCAPPAGEATLLSTLQIGLVWFPDGIGGGSSRFFSEITDHLVAQNVMVHGIVAGKSSITTPRRDGIRIFSAYDAPLIERLRAARAAVRETLATYPVNVVASHFALFTAPCLDAINDLPMVLHFHGPWAAESRIEGASRFATLSQFFVEKLVYSRARIAIVLSAAFRDVLHRSYGVPLENIRVIPGGVDVERFNLSCSRDEARLRLGLSLSRPLVVVVRRLAERMGLENLIAGFAGVKKEHRDVVLAIVGNGPLADRLKRQVRGSDLADSVVFAGRVSEEDLPLYYRAADVSVVPSIALEGFGLVVAESLACGTPAIVTPVGGLPEAVSGLSNALILENSGCAAITSGLRAALAGRLQLPASAECASYARERFSWPIIAKQVKRVYGEVA